MTHAISLCEKRVNVPVVSWLLYCAQRHADLGAKRWLSISMELASQAQMNEGIWSPKPQHWGLRQVHTMVYQCGTLHVYT